MTDTNQNKECKNCDTMSEWCEDNCVKCKCCSKKFLDGEGSCKDDPELCSFECQVEHSIDEVIWRYEE